MIITEPEGVDSKSTPNHHAPTQPLLQDSQPPPPPYHIPSPSYSQIHHPSVYREEAAVRRESAVRRFWSALGVALLIWFVASVVTDRIVRIAHHTGNRRIGQSRWGKPPPRPEPWDGIAQKCINANNWITYYDSPQWISEYPLGAKASFSLPLGSNAFYLLSRGSYQHGQLVVEQSHSPELGDTALVEVKVSYHDSKALAVASVCKLARGVDEYGIGLFTPNHTGLLDENDQLNFEVKFTIPASNTGTLLQIRQFESILPNFSQEIAALGDSVHFGRIGLASTNYPITVQSIRTTEGSFVTANSAIKGLFRADRSLKLVTSNAPIYGFVKLLDLGHNHDNQTTALNISTTNGAIKADIALETPSGIGGAFEVNARTSNALLEMNYSSLPAKPSLQCTARTTNSPAHMVLHKEFDGDFEVESTLFTPSVELQSGQDPSDGGRFRVVDQDEHENRVFGSAHWVDMSSQDGAGGSSRVFVGTTNSPAQLVL
ncbi:hypothetical protein BDN67DRAFT_493660 [Paxillus ammoniavirescens]|nr:hypothetical protein BDN67DRAFT_493660 [Paxillus ammoniavirescens]